MTLKHEQNDSNERLAYRVADLPALLGIGQNAAYELCHREGFPVIKVGKTYIIPKNSLQRWLDEESARQGC